MIRTMLIGAVPVGAIAAAAYFQPELLRIAVCVLLAGLCCLSVGMVVQNVFSDE